MKFIKKKKLYIWISLLFFILVIFYNFRFQIISNVLLTAGYEENIARRYSFHISEQPFYIIKKKIKKIFSQTKNKKDQLELSLSIKKGFSNYDSPNLEFKDGNYYLNIIKSSQTNEFNKTLEYSDIWKDKKPSKIWTTSMPDNSSDKTSKSLIVEAQPKICGKKLIYAKQDGSIGAINYQSGKIIWQKKYGNMISLKMRGFFCKYKEELDTHIILLPTATGVFCINSLDGSLLSKRCRNGRLGAFESRTSPQLINNVVYVATIHPPGIEAYNFLNGKLLWRTNLDGANPWNNFTIDEEKELIFVNMGSPFDWYILDNSKKYKYAGSLIALNLKNGKIVWQFQEHTKDSWNHDFVGQPILPSKKIKGKDAVITLSKSGSIYFLDRDSGLPIFPIKEEIMKIGNHKYKYKKSIKPKPLLNSNYYNYLGKDCKECDINSKIFGPFPPILKLERKFDGHDGGPQWPGAYIDELNNLLILTSSHNSIYNLYVDFIPSPFSPLPDNPLIKKCTSCHDSKGKAKGFKANDKVIIPSLFLTTKIYNFDSLKKYLKASNFHKELDYNDEDLKKAYKALHEYDTKLIKSNQYQYLPVARKIDITDKKIYTKSGFLGKISAISLTTGNLIWQIPAGTYKINDSETIVGSKTYGAISGDGNNEGVSFYTGSFDKKVYAINNTNGKYIWDSTLPASGSALPLIYNTPSERWIFIVATGGRIPNDQSDKIVAFRQKLTN